MYPVVAVLAVLAHVFIVGPLCLLVVVLSGPGAGWFGLVIKAVILVTWFGLGYLGIRAWNRRSWWVLAVPIVAFCMVMLIIGVGNNLGWYLNVMY